MARRSSRFSRSSCLIRSRSSLVSPGRRPPSRSACRTHRRSDSGEQPSFPAIDWIVAHCELYSRMWSKTIRTARSRTSGENLFRLSMTPVSHNWESPANPGRFIWRSLKYEEVYLKAYETVADARSGIGWWLSFYNSRRGHQSLNRKTPDQVYHGSDETRAA